MDTTTLILWNSFIQAQQGSKAQALVECLSEELQKEISSLPALPIAHPEQFQPSYEEIHEIHYSWFCPFLRTLSEREIKLFLAPLSPKQIKGLKQSLLLSNSVPELSTSGSTFLKKTLFQAISPEDLIPISCLPPHPLNQLL